MIDGNPADPPIRERSLTANKNGTRHDRRVPFESLSEWRCYESSSAPRQVKSGSVAYRIVIFARSSA